MKRLLAWLAGLVVNVILVASALVLLLLMLLATRPTPHPTEARVVRYGYTECVPGEGPVYWVRGTVLGTRYEPIVKAHERKHVEQVNRFPSCAEWQAYFEAHQAALEAEAFAAAISKDFTLMEAASWLSEGYPELNIKPADALAMIWFYWEHQHR